MKYLILFALLGLARGDCSGTTWETCTGNCFWDDGYCYPISDDSPFTPYDNYDVEPEDLAELQELQDALSESAIQMKLSDNNGTTQARIYTVLELNGNISTISYCAGEDGGWFNGTGTIYECNKSAANHTESIFLLAKQLEMIVDTFDEMIVDTFDDDGCPEDTSGMTAAEYINAQCCKCP